MLYLCEMSIKPVQKLRIGYVRDDRRRPEKAQRAMLKADGVERVYTDWALLIRQRRPGKGDVLVVSDLWVITDPKRRTVAGGVRQSLMERRAEARRAGVAEIVELSSGLTTADPDQADTMLAAALDIIAGTRKRSKRIGRPRVVWSDSDRVVIRMHWTGRQHANDGAALRAMKADGIKGAYYQRVVSEFGPSGRKPGGDSDNRASQWAKRKGKIKR